MTHQPATVNSRSMLGRGAGTVRTVLKQAPCAVLRWRARSIPADEQLASTIVVAGVPRGGTTWLAEVLARLPGRRLLWEPLYVRRHAAHLPAGIRWREYRAPDEAWPELRTYLHGVLTGRAIRPVLLHRRDYGLRPHARLLVKFCRLNRLLPWFVRRFATRMPLLIVRHPCAVVASQLRHGGYRNAIGTRPPPTFDDTALPEGLLDADQRAFAASLGTWEEALARNWCLDHLVPYSLPSDERRWLVVHYERLLTRGVAELERVQTAIGETLPPAAYDQLHRASRTTQAGSAILSGGDQLRAWQDRLDDDQIERILRVVRTLGPAGLYDEDPMPLADGDAGD